MQVIVRFSGKRRGSASPEQGSRSAPRREGHPSLWRASLLGVVVLGSSCAEPEAPQDYETPSLAPETGQLSLEGTFAYKQVLSQYVRKPVGSGYEQQSITAYTFGPLVATQDPLTFEWSDRICEVVLTELSGAEIALDEGYYQNPATPTVRVQVDALSVGAGLHLPLTIETYGVTLEDPANDALPVDPADPRVYDFDFDAQPGFTIHVDGVADGTIWSIQRYVYQMEGMIVSADRASGLIVGYTEDSYLYASASYLPQQSDTYPDEEPSHNFFELMRVSDDYTCERLKAEKETLFPQ